MKTQEDLYLEYARCITMTREYNEKHGTDVKSWECVKKCGIALVSHPKFEDKLDLYTFALTILEGKPVFVGDKLYFDGVDSPYTVTDMGYEIHGESIKYDWQEVLETSKSWTWTPPPKKRTFEFNGVELPCPVNEKYDFPLVLQGNESGFWTFHFESFEDRSVVLKHLIDFLRQARDKE